MKKYIIILLVATLSFIFASCGQSDDSYEDTDDTSGATGEVVVEKL